MAEANWPVPTPRDEVLSRVVTRGRRIQMINRLMIGGAVAAAAAVTGVGVWLGVSGAVDLVGDDDTSAPAVVTPQGGDGEGGATGGVAYFACPNDRELGELRGGDRVYLTGRDDSGEWVELRSPIDAGVPVWVRAEVVDPDGDADLPEVDCEITELALGVTTTTLPEETPEETTTTTEAEAEDDPTTPTTRPTQATQPTTPNTTPTPTTTQTTTSTTAPDTTTPTPPVINTISKSPNAIWEVDSPGQCLWYGQSDVRTNVSVSIPNASSATLHWSILGESGSIPMERSGSTFSAVFGDLPHSVVPHTWPYYANATLTVVAQGAGGSAQKATSIRVNDCTPG